MVKKTKKALPEVVVGEVWADNDKRVLSSGGNDPRRCEIVRVKTRGRVVVKWLTGASAGKERELKQERFNGRSSGYSKVQDAPRAAE